MKKIFIAMGAMLLGFASINAQTGYDAAKLSEGQLSGTARFVGMGGAMGALGADISTIGTNPAGIGLFRSSSWVGTLGYNHVGNKTDFNGGGFDRTRGRVSFDQFGFVMATKMYESTASLRFINYGFNYRKRRNFNNDMWAGGNIQNGLSQTQQMVRMLEDVGVGVSGVDDMSRYFQGNSGLKNPFYDEDLPYLGVMGVGGELVGVTEYDEKLPNGTIEKREKLIGWNASDYGYKVRETGGLQDFDFNVSANWDDKFYFGGTLGLTNVDYSRSSYYTESLFDAKGNNGYYELMNEMKTTGIGVNLKLGMIWRPFDESPFRIGLAVHTPTWYSLKDTYSALLKSRLNFPNATEAPESNIDLDTKYYADGENVREYQLYTPWKFNVSMGTVVMRMLALGAEYEYEDYTGCSLRYDNGDKMSNQNSYMDEDFKGVHTLRLGAELRPISQVSFRLGYNFSSAMMNKGAYKALAANDMRTDTEYTNHQQKHTLTVGLGLDYHKFFFDVAYMYQKYNSDFYPFSAEGLAATKVKTDHSNVMATFGMRF